MSTVVLTVNQLAAEDEPEAIWRTHAEAVLNACPRIEDEPEAIWRTHAEAVLNACPRIPLGLYEIKSVREIIRIIVDMGF